MKNAMQLKAVMKNIAQEKHISAQLVMQNYMMERFLERVSVSEYRDYFILKGGFLIASMVGLNTRATMDIDATIKGLPVNEQSMREMFQVICGISVEDDITFSFHSIGEIREGDEYTGYRVALSADYPPMQVPLKLDITTGDKITPKEMNYRFQLMLEDRSISLLAYNLETILAEKLETVFSRGDQNTRPRDYYDIYILSKLQSKNIDSTLLKAALFATTEKRGSTAVLQAHQSTIATVKASEAMRAQWGRYQAAFEYAKGITFTEVCDAASDVMQMIKNVEHFSSGDNAPQVNEAIAQFIESDC